MFSFFKRNNRRRKASAPQPGHVAGVQSSAPSSVPSHDSSVEPRATRADPAHPETLERTIPEELIAARAYEIWQLRGCPTGQDGSTDWYAARAELERERLGAAAPSPGDRSY